MDHPDPAVVRRPSHAREEHRHGPRAIVTTYASGFLMGSADLVPGVSGGTVALVLGIYERLVANIRQGARAVSLLLRAELTDGTRALRHVEWGFLVSLLAGVLTAVVTLASGLKHLLDTQPVYLSAAFFGLIVGSVAVAAGELEEHTPRTTGIIAVSAVVTFLLLGLRSGHVTDPSLGVVFAGGALAVCAMILPGISGSFILLMIGLYQSVLDAVDARDLVTVAVFALGAAIGLGSFATFLNWLLRRHRETVLAVLIGLMAGSLRVLWPWPAGADGVGDTRLAAPVAGQLPGTLTLAVVGAVAVVAIAALARRVGAPGAPTA